MRRPRLVALVAGLAGLALGFLLGQMVAAPGAAGTVTSAPTLSAPRAATQATPAGEVTAPARIDTVPFAADRPRGETSAQLSDIGAVVTGRVVEPAGEPAAGARIVLLRSVLEDGTEGAAVLRETQSDDRGRYVFIAEPDTRVWLEARQGNYLPASLPPRRLAPGMNSVEDIVLSEGVSVSGTVRDREGNPVPGARIAARLRRPEVPWSVYPGYVRNAETDRDGGFTLTSIDPQRRVRVTVDHPSLLAQPAFQEVDAGATNVDFVLEKGGVIRGRVTGVEPAVRPTLLVRFIVAWEAEGPDARGRPIRGLIPRLGTVPGSAVDGDGQFEVRGLDTCSGYLLVAQDLSFSPTRIYDIARLRGLSIAPGEVLDGIEIAMSPAPALDGRVVNEEGQGMPGIVIMVDGRLPTGRHVDLSVGTDADGRFHLPGVPRIPIDIEACETRGLLCRPLSDFMPGSGEAVVHLSRPATLEGGIPEHLLADGRQIHFEPLEPLGMVTNWPARPKFSCTGLWPGRYRIQLIDVKEQQVIVELGTVLLRPGETTQLP